MTITERDELCQIVGNLSPQECEILCEVLNELDLGVPWSVHDLAKAVGKVMKGQNSVQCGVCARSVSSIYHAIRAGWLPGSWLDNGEPGPAPVCPECAVKFFDPKYGEPELLPPGQFVG